ncbi:MAG: histidine kinase [Mycobacterium sp.]|uniref:Histidine kinase n=1 Tax=Mycobacterium gordonae TaxID=1778 RepID=A0A1A6B9C8_MYCGO|nr:MULTISPECIES: histidine kinase [Mycobacterium]MBI2699218.1 histidine kinase [Mycobacterium sp.]MCQ4360254.1 histidine kinase [Mycobacterium gordonae]OBR98927.1 histidine kinase [Mycobacterium gordonae]PJE06533.1 MAG: histidine kinase [Mycobacterium sp.]PJE16674.1 MAG: histidine kinase [Mycobacterium sp.]
MDLQPYIDSVRHELTVAASAAGAEAQDLAERLTAPLESALRLALLEALSAATEEITGELAPGSVELRLRGRDPDFVVSPPPEENTFDDADETAFVAPFEDDGATWRVTLRLPERLRASVEAAARRDGASLNSWLVRVAATAAAGGHKTARPSHHTAHRLTGWAR